MERSEVIFLTNTTSSSTSSPAAITTNNEINYEEKLIPKQITDQEDLKLKCIKQFELNNKLKFLRVIWTDVCNKIRCKCISREWLLKNKSEFIYVSVTGVVQSLNPNTDEIVFDSLPPSQSSDFVEVYLVPDWASVRPVPYSPEFLQVFGYFYKSDQVDSSKVVQGQVKPLTPWPVCPRHCLDRSLTMLKSEFGLELKGSFEEEFFLLKRQPDGKNVVEENALDQFSFATVYSLDRYNHLLEEITDHLGNQGIEIEQILKESSPGQFEFTLPYTDIKTACDRHVLFRLTVHAIAFQNGFIASFLPKVFKNRAGSGCHGHFSLWKDGINTTPSKIGEQGIEGISPSSCNFIAGILKHAKGLTPLFNACINSYQRLAPGTWSGATITWGINNKEAFIRIPSSPFSAFKGNSNFEVKTIDHSANLFLAIAGIVYSGMDGLRNKLSPPPATSKIPQLLTDEECKNLGISETLPLTLSDAILAFSNDQLLTDAFGDIAQVFIGMKKVENSRLEKCSFEDQRSILLELY
eukprot:gene7973-9807_t